MIKGGLVSSRLPGGGVWEFGHTPMGKGPTTWNEARKPKDKGGLDTSGLRGRGSGAVVDNHKMGERHTLQTAF